MGLESIKRESIGSQTLRQLRTLIQDGEWAVGTKIPPESVLATDLGIGRSTVREAVRALVHTGLLEARPGDGTYVRATREIESALNNYLEGTQILEIYEVRRAIELEAARLAARHRDEDDLAKMRTALKGRAHNRDPHLARAFLDADMAFHLAIVDAARNPLLGVLYRGFISALKEALIPVVEGNLQRSNTDELHNELYEAIVSGDENRARLATEAHLNSTEDALRRLNPSPERHQM